MFDPPPRPPCPPVGHRWGDGGANRTLVAVALSGVDGPVPHADDVPHVTVGLSRPYLPAPKFSMGMVALVPTDTVRDIARRRT
jgi:hypothetical protein